MRGKRVHPAGLARSYPSGAKVQSKGIGQHAPFFFFSRLIIIVITVWTGEAQMRGYLARHQRCYVRNTLPLYLHE